MGHTAVTNLGKWRATKTYQSRDLLCGPLWMIGVTPRPLATAARCLAKLLSSQIHNPHLKLGNGTRLHPCVLGCTCGVTCRCVLMRSRGGLIQNPALRVSGWAEQGLRVFLGVAPGRKSDTPLLLARPANQDARDFFFRAFWGPILGWICWILGLVYFEGVVIFEFFEG